jgi:hypothetical protein
MSRRKRQIAHVEQSVNRGLLGFFILLIGSMILAALVMYFLHLFDVDR